MPGESAWPTSYDYNWCENTAQGQTKTGPQVTRASAKANRPTSAPTVYATHIYYIYHSKSWMGSLLL